ncbi:hypothetical protein BWD09_08555 [Neisseria dentiae]|uniref:Uncharacterized protein n=1 Tax=Neisseria dentiae TaxID=194197 RepID=A0A1X3D6H8_9NEIS|nr:hypothetical protein BWD09_08555 [Neisseria dentiae]
MAVLRDVFSDGLYKWTKPRLCKGFGFWKMPGYLHFNYAKQLFIFTKMIVLRSLNILKNYVDSPCFLGFSTTLKNPKIVPQKNNKCKQY